MTSPGSPAQRTQRLTQRGKTEHWVAGIVIGALAFLILVGMGFRGVNVAGLSVKAS